MQAASIRVDGYPLLVLLPETEQERVVGLSRGMPRPYWGMVFMFEPPAVARMTMEDTAVPLQIGFVDEDMVIRTVHHAGAHSGIWTSPVRCRCVIEVPPGIPQLKVGSRVQFETRHRLRSRL